MAKTSKKIAIVPLHELIDGQEADCFVMLFKKEVLQTKEGKPYFRVGFRDREREVVFPIWNDGPLAEECRNAWEVGICYKVRALFRETQYGPQLDIRKIRPVNDDDQQDGFDRNDLFPAGRCRPEAMFDQIIEWIEENIVDDRWKQLANSIFQIYKKHLLEMPASTGRHHTYRGGLLEHLLSVAKLADSMAEHFAAVYSEMQPPLHRNLLRVGALLHDIGKLRELEVIAGTGQYSPAGHLVGHVVLGRDVVREAMATLSEEVTFTEEEQLRLEHLLLSHQGTLEMGSPKLPMTAEAMLIAHADRCETEFFQLVEGFAEDTQEGPVTGRRKNLQRVLFRGWKSSSSESNNDEG
ncbi:Dihydroneopterin 2',3'-cyclic phosphate phosphodiesterase [Planctomycetales bacterium 10988]|nr:Dihydroneopterin 2',3'-cyclic phosphate phosphodiesterase [Planctomycetales bacterium 10988]